MSDRRAARVTADATGRARWVGDGLPPDLAMGPCLEVWDDPDEVAPPWHQNPKMWHTIRARNRWANAVRAWAVESGWANDERRPGDALRLARTSLPWSRDFLIAQGRQDQLAQLEGR